MKDIYLLCKLGDPDNPILLAADDIERCNKEMAKFTAAEQDRLRIFNADLLEGDE